MSYGQKRSERVGDLIKKEIASMILHGEIQDPRIGFVTITKVKMSADIKEARVYFSQIGSVEERANSLDGLSSASGYIRRNLSKRLDLRHIPSIHFHYDDSLDYSEHIEKVIKEIKKGDGL